MKKKQILSFVIAMMLANAGLVLAEEKAPAAAPAPTAASEVTTQPTAVSSTPAPATETTNAAPATSTAPASTNAASPEAEGPIVIDYSDADLGSVLRTLAARAGINLLLGEEVTGKVTVHLEGVDYEKAMKIIVENKGYAYLKDDNLVRVRSRDALDTVPPEVKVVTLNYAKAEEVKKTLEATLTKQGRIQVDARSNMLVLSDTPTNLAKLEKLIAELDAQTPQVMIEARFVETTKNPKKDLGINWAGALDNHQVSIRRPDPQSQISSTDNPSPLEFAKKMGPGGGWTYPTAIIDAGEFNWVISYFASDSDTELLANPRVVTTDNGKAKLAIAEQYPIPNFAYNEQQGQFVISGFNYKDIGIVLNVTPRINKNEFVTLDVAPEVSSSSENATLVGGGTAVQIPIINTRTANTTVLIKSGNTLAIGGLMQQDSANGFTKVPVMGDLPGIGALFRSKSLNKKKRELLIFVTPTILAGNVNDNYKTETDRVLQGKTYADDAWMPKDNAKPNPSNLNPWKKTSSATTTGQ
jgi:type IV pilus secretin PilQ/predicted competence protein